MEEANARRENDELALAKGDEEGGPGLARRPAVVQSEPNGVGDRLRSNREGPWIRIDAKGLHPLAGEDRDMYLPDIDRVARQHPNKRAPIDDDLSDPLLHGLRNLLFPQDRRKHLLERLKRCLPLVGKAHGDGVEAAVAPVEHVLDHVAAVTENDHLPVG